MIKKIVLMSVLAMLFSCCVYADGCGEYVPKSIRYYKNQVKSNPIDVCARYNLAQTYFRKNKPQESAKEYALIIYINPMEEDAYIERSYIYSIYNNREAGEHEIGELLKKVPNSVHGNALMSEFYKNILDYENALKHINIAIEQSKGTESWFIYNRADILKNMGKYKEAIKDYTKFIEQDDSENFWPPYEGRRECYEAIGKAKEAEVDKKIVEDMKKMNKNKCNIIDKIKSEYFLFKHRIHVVY